MSKKKVLVTGAAGFIGHHLSKLLNTSGYQVVGLDNINDYYDQRLKLARLEDMGIDPDSIAEGKMLSGDIDFIKLDLVDREGVKNLFKTEQFDYVVNLAAQAGGGIL